MKARELLDEATRLARVGLKSRIAFQLRPTRLPALVRVLGKRGLRVTSLFAAYAALKPDAVVLVDGERRITWAEANDVVEHLARALADEGVQRRDAIAIALENRAEYVLAWFAAMRLGARVVHAGVRLQSPELAHLVDDAHVRLVIASAASLETARAVGRSHGEVRVVVVGGAPLLARERSWDEVVARGAALLPLPAARVATSESVVYTSGTTGRPKGAVRDFARFGPIEGARILDRLPFRFGDRHLVVAPLHHSAAQAFTIMHLALGGEVHLLPHFDPELVLETLSRHRIHSTFLVPTMLGRIVALPSAAFLRNPPLDLRAIVCGAGEMVQSIREKAIYRFGASRIFDFYGATELGWVTLISGPEMLRKPGSVGRPLPGQDIAIFDAAGHPLPVGQVGLVHVRNEQRMEGYLGDASSAPSGFASVEDLGRLDEEGYLFLAGRARDMVKTGGINVYPAEVEAVLADHPSVREVAVVGAKDPEWGERLVAVIVPNGTFDREAVVRFARERLAGYKVPKQWIVVDALPRNALGKVQKERLRSGLA